MATRFEMPGPGEDVDPAYLELLGRVERLTWWLDSRWRIPGTRFHVGIDPLVGIVPVAGDLAMACVSLWAIGIAWRLGARPLLLGHMLSNVVVDVLIGIIPFIGPVLDAFFRANERNLRLLVDEMSRRRRGPLMQDKAVVPETGDNVTDRSTPRG